MFKNRMKDGRNNACGKNVTRLRKGLGQKCSQNELAKKLQLAGLDLEKNAVQRIESGQRFVTDVEIRVIAEFFGVSVDELLRQED